MRLSVVGLRHMALMCARLICEFARGRVRRGLALIVFFFFSFVPLARPALAGQQTAAGIIGQVRDESGGVLPGVTVTATSPALQVPEVLGITDGQGEYRLTPLPLGTYTVVYSLVGFQTIRHEDVRLALGFVAKLDVVLVVGALEETVTVTGAAPVVDVTSTAVATHFTRETLDLTPTSRNNFQSLLNQTPGVRSNFEVGGANIDGAVQFKAFGQSGNSWQTIEGVYVGSDNSQGATGNYFDFSVFEEARVQTVGNDAEVPQRGISLAGLVKTGGNDFHGNLFWAQTGDLLQSTNIDDNLRAQGIAGAAKITRRWDVSEEFGGRLVRDKLWFYQIARRRASDQEVLNAFQDDGSPALNTQLQWFHTEKLSYQMTRGNRFVGFYQYGKKNTIRAINQFTAWESRPDNRFYLNTGKVEWQAVRGSSLVTSLQYGLYQFQVNYFNHAPAGTVATMDIKTQKVAGPPVSAGNYPYEWSHNTRGNVTWYRPDLLGGNHEFKSGFDSIWGTYNRGWHDRGAAQNYQLVFNGGAPFQVKTWNYPVAPHNDHNYLGFYVRDNWTLGRRLTLELGVRYAYDNAYLPAQCRDDAVPREFGPAQCWAKVQPNVWNSVAPRLHAAYDLFGNSKMVIKGGWGRFDELRQLDPELFSMNRNAEGTTTWKWHDLNGNKAYDPGEVNLNPNESDFVLSTGGTSGVVNPNEREPKSDEFLLSLERELIPNFGIRVSGIYTRTFDTYRVLITKRPYDVYNIPITNPDPGPDGTPGTADDPGTLVTYYDFPAALQGAQFTESMLINNPNASTYKSFEVAASKRLSNNWLMTASYSTTKKDIPFPDSSGYNPNQEINTADRTREWLGRVSGAYVFPYQVTLSANFEHRSGDPWARQVLFLGGKQIPTIVLNVEPIGSRRLPNTNLLDLRVEKRFPLTAGTNVLLRVNIFNALNINTVTAVNQRSSSSFSIPTGVVLPRIVEFSTSFTF